MSEHKVPYTKILDIQPHPGADRLEVATVYGFQVIVKKGQYKQGDNIVYVPIDSILPKWLEDRIFPEGAKIKLHNSRVKQIRIRGLASQGMIIDIPQIRDKSIFDLISQEQDLSHALEITKYEPVEPGHSVTLGKGKNRSKKQDHPSFHKYNGLENIKWFPDLFKEGDEVVIQEKLHGTNCRIALLPYVPNTWFKRILKALGLTPKQQLCYGSNNVEISAASVYSGWYGEDLYGACLKRCFIASKIKLGEIFYGEVIGPGIQKGYNYSLKEHEFVIFDIKVFQPDGSLKWLNPSEVEQICKERELLMVPKIYEGPYNKQLAYSLTKGASIYDPKTEVREGVVIKAAVDYHVEGNKKALKWVSEDYLAADNTDFH